MNYDETAFQKISKDTNVNIEILLNNSKEFILFNIHPKSNGNAIGNVIKEHKDCKFKIGDLIYSSNAIIMGNEYLFYGAYPDNVIEYIPPKIKEKPKILNTKKSTNKLETSSEELAKIITITSELYNLNPIFFKEKFRGFNMEVKLNKEIEKISINKSVMSRVYGAINLFLKMTKEQKKDFNYSYTKASQGCDIPEKTLRSIIGKRNSFLKKRLN